MQIIRLIGTKGRLYLLSLHEFIYCGSRYEEWFSGQTYHLHTSGTGMFQFLTASVAV